MCDQYVTPKKDYLYRGDVLEDVPFVACDGLPILIPNRKPDPRNPFIPIDWKLRKAAKDFECLAALQYRRAVIMTRTCEGDKLSGVKKVFPYLYMAPLRPLSDFDGLDADGNPETGQQYAEKVLNGFPNGEECYRFAYLPPCADHKMAASLVCFREMQPVHLRYLVERPKLIKLGIPLVHYVLERYSKFMVQTDRDDAEDQAPEAENGSRTVSHYKAENAKRPEPVEE